MLKKKFFCFDQKNPVFVKNLEVKLSFVLYKFSTYVIYEWYLEFLQRSHFEGVDFVDKLTNVQINCCKQVISIQGEFVI